MSALDSLAKLIGVRRHQAEDALYSERAARAVLSRRDLFAAGGALAAGSAFSFALPPRELHPMIRCLLDVVAETNVQTMKNLAWLTQLPFVIASGGQTEAEFRGRMQRDLYRLTLEVLNQ